MLVMGMGLLICFLDVTVSWWGGLRAVFIFIHSNVSFRDLFLINYGTDDAMILIQNQQKGREKAQIGP